MAAFLVITAVGVDPDDNKTDMKASGTRSMNPSPCVTVEAAPAVSTCGLCVQHVPHSMIQKSEHTARVKWRLLLCICPPRLLNNPSVNTIFWCVNLEHLLAVRDISMHERPHHDQNLCYNVTRWVGHHIRLSIAM